jgi:hypothetical protein
MIRFVDVAVGEGARVHCSRCAPSAVVEPVFRPADDILAEAAGVCASWSAGAGPNVRLAGAEPFAHPDLPRIVSGVIGAGCRRLALDTDAAGMRSETNARGALVSGVRHIRCTVLAGTEGLHDALSGVPGLFDATRAGMAAFRAVSEAEGLDVSVTTMVPVCRHNVSDLPAAVAVAVESGADRIEIVLTDGGIDLDSAVRWITAACDTGVVNGVWVEVAGLPICALPGYDLHLADAVRAREGSKSPVCASCALDAVCGGAPSGASVDQLSALAPPVGAATLAAGLRRARAGEVR